MNPTNKPGEPIEPVEARESARDLTAVIAVAGHARRELSRSIVGQADALDLLLLTLLCGGHALVEGVPGLAKTLAVRTLAQILTLGFHRVQCTPDLMPADIIGSSVLNMATGQFTFRHGPVFTELLLVDEINRMPPRTQAALLEAMEERQVTVDGTSYTLSPAFTAFATQNPVEFEGTYPLPEAELDRFMLKIRFDYPSAAAKEEESILERHHLGFDTQRLEALALQPLPGDLLMQARAEVRAVRVEPALFGYIADIARRTRDWGAVALGASPRATVSLMHVAKGFAALEGRDFLIPDDVKRAAGPVLRHRLVLKPEADLEGVTPGQVVTDILGAVEVPT
jgi:MoxR-like ATPase